MKFLVFLALIVLASSRLQDFRQHRQKTTKDFSGPVPANNYWWPVNQFNSYAVCASRCTAQGDTKTGALFRLAELKDASGKVLEQYCCNQFGTERIVNLGADHPELEGWDGLDGGPTFAQLDPQSRVCPVFERTVKPEDQAKFGGAWFNQRRVSCPWTGEY